MIMRNFKSQFHLHQLEDMVYNERLIAAAAYRLNQYPQSLNDKEREFVADTREMLEEFYLHFKLADSPEAARFLIRQIEEDACSQGRNASQLRR